MAKKEPGYDTESMTPAMLDQMIADAEGHDISLIVQGFLSAKYHCAVRCEEYDDGTMSVRFERSSAHGSPDDLMKIAKEIAELITAVGTPGKQRFEACEVAIDLAARAGRKKATD